VPVRLSECDGEGADLTGDKAANCAQQVIGFVSIIAENCTADPIMAKS
jgi:hypothetical protein